MSRDAKALSVEDGVEIDGMQVLFDEKANLRPVDVVPTDDERN